MKSLVERIILHLFKLCGLICVKNTVDGPIFLCWPFIFGIILVWLTFPVTFYGMMLDMSIPNSRWMPTTTAAVVTFIQYTSIISSALVIVVLAAWNYKIIGKVYSTIETIEIKLNVHQRCVKTYIIFLILIILVIIIFLGDILTCYHIDRLYLWYIPTYFYGILFIVFIFQLLLITNRIKVLFHTLNAELRKTLQSMEEQRIPKNLPAVDILPASEIKSLPSLCDLHWDICEAIDYFNTAFKTQLQFQFLTKFIQLIDYSYFISPIFKESISSGLNFQFSLTTLAFCVLQIAQIFAIVLPCGAATETIKSFLTLLEVHRTDFHCGIFTLNESVVSAVTGSVTTYLVILLQFPNQDFDS